MPQFDISAFRIQLVWFVLIFLVLYFQVVRNYLSLWAASLKLRSRLVKYIQFYNPKNKEAYKMLWWRISYYEPESSWSKPWSKENCPSLEESWSEYTRVLSKYRGKK
jgi:hypothetical protein